MSNTAKGTAYEQFVQGLYQTLHGAEGFENVKIEHNKTNLVGRSGCAHQIDVYWEFTIAGKSYRTAIECKAFDQAVPIGKIRDFYGVLADVPGLQGIFVSLFGFQSGAKQYAEHYGIDLKEIRPPADADWEGRVQDIKLRFFIVMPKITAHRLDVTKAFLATLKDDERLDVPFSGTTYDSFVVDGQGAHVASLEEIRQRLPAGTQAATGLVETVPFPGCFYPASNGLRIPIDSVTVRYDVEVEQADILGKRAAKAIIKDVNTGDTLFFDQKGNVRSVRK